MTTPVTTEEKQSGEEQEVSELEKVAQEFAEKLLPKIHNMPPEFARLVDEKFWDLL